MSKSFNVVIVDARKKLIITMLEDLRLYMMDKVLNMKAKGQRQGNQICPKIRELLNEVKKRQRHYQVLPCGLHQFEVRGTRDAYEVDLERKTCPYRLWQVNGIGYVHYIACISFLNICRVICGQNVQQNYVYEGVQVQVSTYEQK